MAGSSNKEHRGWIFIQGLIELPGVLCIVEVAKIHPVAQPVKPFTGYNPAASLLGGVFLCLIAV